MTAVSETAEGAERPSIGLSEGPETTTELRVGLMNRVWPPSLHAWSNSVMRLRQLEMMPA